MVNKNQTKQGRAIKVNFQDDKVTAYGGLVLAERLATRLGLWSNLEKNMPKRRGYYDWLTIIKSGIMGLLTGSRGTYATEDIRQDDSALALLGLAKAPEEATFWRCLEALGSEEIQKTLKSALLRVARCILSRSPRRQITLEGFVPVWADGSLLEGSPNREGTKYIPEKGKGLLWSTIYVGSVLAAQRLARESEGEKTVVRSLLPEVVKDVLKATRLDRKALLFLDSLHGDGPTLEDVEACGLHYLIGANKLVLTQKVLQDQPEFVWEDTGSDPSRQIEKSGICVCQIQCAGWKKARTLIGKRWMLTGTFLYHYAGVLTDLEPADVKHIMNRKMSYAASLWSLYNRKMGMEDYYKEPLEDLGLHHPPCQEYERNAGFYAVAALAHVLGRGVDLLGGDRKGALRVNLQLLELNTLDFLSMALGVRRHGKFVESGYESYFIWVCRYTGTLHDPLHPLPSVTTVFSVREILFFPEGLKRSCIRGLNTWSISTIPTGIRQACSIRV